MASVFITAITIISLHSTSNKATVESHQNLLFSRIILRAWGSGVGGWAGWGVGGCCHLNYFINCFVNGRHSCVRSEQQCDRSSANIILFLFLNIILRQLCPRRLKPPWTTISRYLRNASSENPNRTW